MELKDDVECENPNLIEKISDYIENKPTNISIEEYEEDSSKLDDIIHNMKEMKDIFDNRKKDVINEINICKELADSEEFNTLLDNTNEEINNIKLITEHSVHLLNHKLADILRYKRRYYNDDKNLLISLYNILSEEYPHYIKIEEIDEYVNSIIMNIRQEKDVEKEKEMDDEKDGGKEIESERKVNKENNDIGRDEEIEDMMNEIEIEKVLKNVIQRVIDNYENDRKESEENEQMQDEMEIERVLESVVETVVENEKKNEEDDNDMNEDEKDRDIEIEKEIEGVIEKAIENEEKEEKKEISEEERIIVEKLTDYIKGFEVLFILLLLLF